jgi:hypothetical protein
MNDPVAYIRAHAETIAIAHSQVRHHLGDRPSTVRVEEHGGAVVIRIRIGEHVHVVQVDERLLELYIPSSWRDYTFAMVRAEIERL